VRISFLPLRPSCYLLTIHPGSFNQPYVPSSVCRHVFHRRSINLQSCFGRVQTTDKDRHFLPSSSRPAAVLRLPQCHSRRPSSPSPGVRPISKCQRKFDKVARPHCKCLVRFLCDLGKRCWAGKFQDVKPLEIYPLTCMTTDIPTSVCSFCWDWCPPPSEPLP